MAFVFQQIVGLFLVNQSIPAMILWLVLLITNPLMVVLNLFNLMEIFGVSPMIWALYPLANFA